MPRTYPLKGDHLDWWDHRCATCGNYDPIGKTGTGGCWAKGITITAQGPQPKKTVDAAHGAKCKKFQTTAEPAETLTPQEVAHAA